MAEPALDISIGKRRRPALGQELHAADRLYRSKEYSQAHGRIFRHWQRWRERLGGSLGPRPVDGMYIGHRIYSNGSVEIWGDDMTTFHPTESFEAWLIVPNENSAPVAVLPEDCDL